MRYSDAYAIDARHYFIIADYFAMPHYCHIKITRRYISAILLLIISPLLDDAARCHYFARCFDTADMPMRRCAMLLQRAMMLTLLIMLMMARCCADAMLLIAADYLRLIISMPLIMLMMLMLR